MSSAGPAATMTRLPLVTDASSVGRDFDAQSSVLLRAILSKMTRDRARRVGFQPPGDPVTALVAALSPKTYQGMTRPIDGGNPEAPSAAAGVGGLFMSMGGMPANIARSEATAGGMSQGPRGRHRFNLAPSPTLESQMAEAGKGLPKGAEQLVNRLHENFVRKPAEESIGRFSNTSKMPCPSWSISAGLCKTGSKLKQVSGSVCEGCFADSRGNYTLPDVKHAMERRIAAYNRDPENFGANIAKAMPRDQKEFRWFDSGDVQSPQMFSQIVEAARLRPDVKFWMPTKEGAMVESWTRKNGPLPDNLAVRQSIPMKDVLPSDVGPREKRSLPLAGVTTDRAKATCAATMGDKTCKTAECRDCWDKAKDVVYLEH